MECRRSRCFARSRGGEERSPRRHTGRLVADAAEVVMAAVLAVERPAPCLFRGDVAFALALRAPWLRCGEMPVEHASVASVSALLAGGRVNPSGEVPRLAVSDGAERDVSEILAARAALARLCRDRGHCRSSPRCVCFPAHPRCTSCCAPRASHPPPWAGEPASCALQYPSHQLIRTGRLSCEGRAEMPVRLVELAERFAAHHHSVSLPGRIAAVGAVLAALRALCRRYGHTARYVRLIPAARLARTAHEQAGAHLSVTGYAGDLTAVRAP